MKKWFLNVDCIEELKAQYKKLCFEHHPDLHKDNPNANREMQEINDEYEKLFERYANIHRSTREDGPRTYTAAEPTKETPQDFIRIVTELFKLDGISAELCGRWIWVSGETRKHKDRLKELGCKWSKNKQMWSWHFPEDAAMTYKGKKAWDIGRIRSTFGSEKLEPETEKKSRVAIPA